MAENNTISSHQDLSQIQATNNQVQLATILAAHFTATRNSVDDWLRRRDQYITLYVTAVFVIFGYYISNPINIILLLIPFLTIIMIFAYLSADLHIAYLCKWLTQEYTEMLEKYVKAYNIISLQPWHWDNSSALKEFYKKRIGTFRYIFLIVVFILSNILGPVFEIYYKPVLKPVSLIPGIITSIISLGIIIYVYLIRKKMALNN